jgi:GAF domain-containing protein
MAPAPRNPAELQRLLALLQQRLAHAASDECFDALARGAAMATGAPLAIISWADAARPWFICRIGVDLSVPRDRLFCDHALAGPKPLVVTDARRDPRFADHPLVVAPPHVRAYLGAPLITADEQILGALCAIETEPRAWGQKDISIIADLAHVAAALMAARERQALLAGAIEALAARTNGKLVA